MMPLLLTDHLLIPMSFKYAVDAFFIWPPFFFTHSFSPSFQHVCKPLFFALGKLLIEQMQGDAGMRGFSFVVTVVDLSICRCFFSLLRLLLLFFLFFFYCVAICFAFAFLLSFSRAVFVQFYKLKVQKGQVHENGERKKQVE